MASITSANSVLMLGVTNFFPTPQQLQGFGADDAYSVDNVDNAEIVMGVDAKKSTGWIPQIKVMHVTLQADSASNTFFEAVYAAEEATHEKFEFFGVLDQPSVNKSYACVKGTLKNYSPFADGKKVLQPRKFEIHWESIIPSPV